MAKLKRQLAQMAKISFKNPPLVELIFGAQFGPGILSLSDIFDFYSAFLKERYPLISERERLATTIELPDRPPQVAVLSPGGSRKMFTNKQDDILVQLQEDRCLLNWRKGNNDASYPHFEPVYDEFKATLENLLSINPRLPGAVNQYEITYVDHIEDDAIRPGMFDLSGILSVLNMPQPVKALNFSCTIPQVDINGNLHVSIKSGMRNRDKRSVVVLETTCRGFSREITMDEWVSRAHEILVNFFEQAISPDLQRKWSPIQIQ